MSTKIYNGYRLPKMTLEELNQWGIALRKTVHNEAKKQAVILQFGTALTILEKAVLGTLTSEERDNYDSCNPWLAAYICLQKEYQESRSKNISSIVNLECEAQIIPIHDKILVLIYCENARILKKVQQLPGLTEYNYWNNTDPDETVSEIEWKQRAKDWEIAIGSDRVNQRGFGLECLGRYFPAEQFKKIGRKHLRDNRETWARDIAKRNLKERQWRKIERKSGWRNNVFQELQKIERWIKTPGLKALETETKRVYKKLPQEPLDQLLQNPLQLKRRRKK